MNYMTVLARLYINFVTGINLESSFALWVNFFGYFSSFLELLLALVHGIVRYFFLLLSLSLAHSLSRSSWLLLSLLILALDPSLSSSFFKKFHQLRYESAMDGAEKINFSLVSVMAAMLRDSVVVVVVVVRTRPRAIPLAMITTRKWIHGFPLISHDANGAPLGSSAINSLPNRISLKKREKIHCQFYFLCSCWCNKISKNTEFPFERAQITWTFVPSAHAIVKL